MRWFLADVLGPFSVNVVSFSRNGVSVARIFSVNLVPKQRLFAVPAIYVLGPLQIAAVRKSGLDCFDTFLTTLENRMDLITNYFISRSSSG